MIRLFILTSLLTIPNLLFAAPFVPFQNIPFIADTNSLTTDSYINALYQISISLAAILVVLKLILAGTQYMLSDIVTSKQKAKDDIKGALLGLLIILAAVTLLNTINPNLTNINFLSGAPTAPAMMNNSVGGTDTGTTTTPYEECQERGGRLIRNQVNNQMECRIES